MSEAPATYPSSYIFSYFQISPNDYKTFGAVVSKYKLPHFKVGKKLLFPKAETDARLEVIKIAGMKKAQGKDLMP